MTPSEFEARLRELLAAYRSATENVACIECAGCRKCVRSTFCRGSEGLVACHYCNDCTDCTDSAHCTSCQHCLGCSHCLKCSDCTQSAYLTRCVGLSGCSYCFGCVGLQNKDFHILNERFERSAYFAATSELMRGLRL